MVYKVESVIGKNFKRCGVIPYTKYKNSIWFGLGIDRRSGDVTDFGGSFEYKKDRDCIDAALREFSEESLNVFGIVERHLIYNNIIAFDDENLIIFIPIEIDPFVSKKAFEEYNYSKSEMSKIIWIRKDHFKEIILGKLEGYKMYSKVRGILNLDICKYIL